MPAHPSLWQFLIAYTGTGSSLGWFIVRTENFPNVSQIEGVT